MVGYVRRKIVRISLMCKPFFIGNSVPLGSDIVGETHMTQILFASHNGGKVKEIAHLLKLEDVELLTMADVHLHDFNVDETGETYEENATLKAKTLGDKTRHITLADDSGIEVEALGNKPGIYSARYSKGSDTDRCVKMLKELEDKQNRNAKFVAVIVYYDPTAKQKHVFRGEVKGVIATQIMGEHGFGYDPIFIPEGYQQTMAELGNDVKNEISHRARAVAAFKEWWLTHV